MQFIPFYFPNDEFTGASTSIMHDRTIFSARVAALLCIQCLLIAPVLFAQDSKENSEFKLAVGLYKDGMYDLAAEQLKNFIAAYPSTSQGIEARYYLGLTQKKLKKFDDARVTFQNFALSYPDDSKAPEAWTNVADAFAAVGNEREAASAYERVKTFHPKSPLVPDALVRAAALYRHIGDREHAKTVLRSILQDYSSSTSATQARLQMAELLADDGDFEKAGREAKRVVENTSIPELKTRSLLFLGKLQSSIGLFVDAQATFGSILTSKKITPESAEASLESGLLDISAHRYSSALERLAAVASASAVEESLQVRALFGIGRVHLLQHDFASARASYEKIFTSFPDNAMSDRAMVEAGRALLEEYSTNDLSSKTDHADIALTYAKKILGLSSSPYERDALVLAVRSCELSHRYVDAARYYQMFFERYAADPSAPDMMFSFGSLYQNDLNDDRKAVGMFERLIQQYPQSPLAVDAMMSIGQSQERMGEHTSALKTYLDVKSQYPASERIGKVNEHIDELSNYKILHLDEGIKSLATLIGSLSQDRAAGNISFQLGKIFFDDLKDYTSAAEQFSAAIEKGLDTSNLIEASYLRARAYHLLSAADTTKRLIAGSSYDTFLKQFPSSTFSDDAAFYAYTLEHNGGNQGMTSAMSFLSNHPFSRHSGKILLDLSLGAENDKKWSDAISYDNRAIAFDSVSFYAVDALVHNGFMYEELNNTDSAVVSFGRALNVPATNPGTFQALIELTKLESKNKHYDNALLSWKKILNDFFYVELSDDDLYRLLETYLASGHYDETLVLAQELSRQNELRHKTFLSPAYEFYVASAYEKKGDIKSAIRTYADFLSKYRQSPKAGDAFYALGRIARTQGNTDLASAYFKEASATGGTQSTSSDIADLLFQSGAYTDAAKQYRMLAQSGDSAALKREYLSRAVVASFRADDLAGAQSSMQNYQSTYGKDKPAEAEFEYERANYYYRKQDYVTARKFFEKVGNDYEDTHFGPYGRYYVGKILEVSNKLADAAGKYDDVLKKYPRSDVIPRVLLSLGNMHFNAERFEEAIRFYQQITAQPGKAGDILPYAMNNLIEAYESTKLYNDAIKITQDFIARFPNDESTLEKKIKLGTLYSRVGYYDQAVAHFQNLISEAGSENEAEIRYDIGEAYYNKADYQQAILEFLKVPYLASKQGKIDWTATSLYMAGQAYEKMSKLEEAITMYQQIIDRPGIEATFKAGARKEIERVKSLIKKGSQ